MLGQQLPRARLEVAWSVYERVFVPALAWRSQRTYRSIIRRALADLDEQLELAKLLEWHRVRLMTERGLSCTYANQCVAVLRVITKRAAGVTGDIELAAMFAQVPLIPTPVRAPRCPPPDFLARVLEVARNPAERAFLMLAALAGLRRGELFGLRPEDYDRELGVLRVVRQRRMPHRKNRRPHSVRVNAVELRRAIEWTIDNRESCRARTGWHRGSADGYLFPWSFRYVEFMLERFRRHLRDEADRYLPRGWGIHVFRHWGASELARAGRSSVQVQVWLGDSDPAIACRYVDLLRGQTSGSVGVLAARWRASEKARSPASRRPPRQRKSTRVRPAGLEHRRAAREQ